MLLLLDSRVTYLKPTPQYRRPTVTPIVVKEDDDDLFLAAWYMYMTNWYKQEYK